jgi:hypothetical protein
MLPANYVINKLELTKKISKFVAQIENGFRFNFILQRNEKSKVVFQLPFSGWQDVQ